MTHFFAGAAKVVGMAARAKTAREAKSMVDLGSGEEEERRGKKRRRGWG